MSFIRAKGNHGANECVKPDLDWRLAVALIRFVLFLHAERYAIQTVLSEMRRTTRR